LPVETEKPTKNDVPMTVINCPSCRRELQLPKDLLGKLVRCPACSQTFTGTNDSVGESSEPRAQSSEPGASATGDNPPAPATSDPVPTVELEEDNDRPWEQEYQPYQGVRRDSEPHRASLVLTLGILSIVLSATTLLSVIGLGLGITAWIMGYRDMKKMRANQMDPQGFGSTQSGFICGIIGTSLGSICSLYCLGHLAVMGFFMVGASRMTPAPAPAPIPKKAPAKPGKGEAPVLDTLGMWRSWCREDVTLYLTGTYDSAP
jgi:LSD1 subclass zinc finger protein